MTWNLPLQAKVNKPLFFWSGDAKRLPLLSGQFHLQLEHMLRRIKFRDTKQSKFASQIGNYQGGRHFKVPGNQPNCSKTADFYFMPKERIRFCPGLNDIGRWITNDDSIQFYIVLQKVYDMLPRIGLKVRLSSVLRG